MNQVPCKMTPILKANMFAARTPSPKSAWCRSQQASDLSDADTASRTRTRGRGAASSVCQSRRHASSSVTTALGCPRGKAWCRTGVVSVRGWSSRTNDHASTRMIRLSGNMLPAWQRPRANLSSASASTEGRVTVCVPVMTHNRASRMVCQRPCQGPWHAPCPRLGACSRETH